MEAFKNKIALVTGGSRGIGKSIALYLAKAGAKVAINYYRSQKETDALVGEINHNAGNSIAVQANVSEPEEVTRMLREINDKWGNVEILVNNAGIAIPQKIEDATLEDFDHTIKTNLRSTFLITQAVLPAMRKNKWGRILMISSVAAQTGGKVGIHYAASKAGQLGLMHHYATNLAAEGITVNAIAPALIKTDMLDQFNPNPDIMPVKRFGTVDEVADMALSILRNGYITNQTFNVDGGMYPR